MFEAAATPRLERKVLTTYSSPLHQGTINHLQRTIAVITYTTTIAGLLLYLNPISVT
jgi:hypothetical protein